MTTSSAPRMRDLKCPTLVLGGKEDRIVDHREGERAAVEIPHGNGHWLSLPRCGHAPQIEMPRLINRLVVALPDLAQADRPAHLRQTAARTNRAESSHDTRLVPPARATQAVPPARRAPTGG